MTDSNAPAGAPSTADLAAYVEAAKRLLAHGGYERTGDVTQARDWGFAHIVAYLEAHERPDARPSVHVAGTKGKGSVATIVEAILRAAGAHTLLLTSPDLHSARERIAIDGAPIGPARFAAVATRLLDDPAAARWSYFELLTVMGWLAGAEAGCDWNVVEVGLGGRLDTTNAMVTNPSAGGAAHGKAVAVITPIDLEHTEILGDTIAQIAAEKAGIITGPLPVVAAPMRASALDVIRARCLEAGATLHELATECALRVMSRGLEGQTIDLRTPVRTYRALRTSLLGQHQAENIATAVRAAEEAWAAVAAARGLEGDAAHSDAQLPEAAVTAGVANVRMPGRAEVIRQRPLTLVDGLHTPLAARRFREALDALPVPRRRVWVIGMLGGRAIAPILEPLIGEGDDVVVAPPPSERAADVAAIVRAARDLGALPQRAKSVAEAIDRATEQAGERGAVIVVGSLYTVAAAREHLLAVTSDHLLGIR